MSAFAEVSRAVERVTRVRGSFTRKLVADCPVCRRRRRLEVVDFDSGKVGIICHGGCDTELVRESLGLPWSAFFEDVSYAAPQRLSAAQLVLRAVGGDRWTLTTHEFGSDGDLALAVECLERLVAARHKVRGLLRYRSGRRIDWWLLPLTVGFLQDLTDKLGRRVGEHRAAQMIHQLVDLGLIEFVGFELIVRKGGIARAPIYRLSDAAQSQLSSVPGSKLSEAKGTGSLLAPAMNTLLSAEDGLSRLGGAVIAALLRAESAHDRLGRSPPRIEGGS